VDGTGCVVSNLRGVFLCERKLKTQLFAPQHPVLGNSSSRAAPRSKR